MIKKKNPFNMQRQCSVSTDIISVPSVNIIGHPWTHLCMAIRSIFMRDSDAKLWYSFMAPENKVRDEFGPEITTRGFDSNGLTQLQTLAEMEKAFVEIADLFQKLFSRTYTTHTFKLNLLHRGTTLIEKGTSIPSDYFAPAYPLLSGVAVAENVGDIRLSMVSGDGPGFTLAYAYTPSTNGSVIGDVGGDIRFDAAELWREDDDHTRSHDSFSLGYVTVHECLHAFGLGHDVAPNSIMNAVVKTSDSLHKLFPGGLEDSQEFFTIHKAYAGTPLAIALGKRRIYRLDGTSVTNPNPDSKQKWQGALHSVTVSPAGYVWGCGRRNFAWFRKKVSAETPFGDGWLRLSGRLKKIHAGALIVGVNSHNVPYIRTGVTTFLPQGTGWKRLFGQQLDSICCSPAALNDQIALYGTYKGKVFFRTDVSFENLEGKEWKLIDGARAVQIAVGCFGKLVLCMNWHGKVYRRVGITASNLAGTGWAIIKSSLKMKAIAVSPTGEVYGVTRSGVMVRRVGISAANLHGTSWVALAVRNVDTIAVGFEIA